MGKESSRLVHGYMIRDTDGLLLSALRYVFMT